VNLSYSPLGISYVYSEQVKAPPHPTHTHTHTGTKTHPYIISLQNSTRLALYSNQCLTECFHKLKEIYKEHIPTDTLILIYSRQLRHGSAEKSVFDVVVFISLLCHFAFASRTEIADSKSHIIVVSVFIIIIDIHYFL